MPARLIIFILSATAAWSQQSFLPAVIAAAPNGTLYASHNGALLLSTNGGSTWIPMFVTAPGLPQPPVKGLIIDPASGTLYLATTTAAGAMWRSQDGGTTWTNTNTGLPTNAGDIDFFKEIAGPPSTLFAKLGNQLYGSLDGATSWRQQGFLPGSSSTFQIGDYTGNPMYYLDAVNFLTYQSLDGGHAWSPVGSLAGLGPPNYHAIALGLLYAPQGYLFASVDGFGPGVAAYLSTGGGGSFADQTSAGLGIFTAFYAGITGPIYAVAKGPSGFYRSKDAGQTWQSIGLTFGTLYALNAVNATQPTTIYATRVGTSPAFVRSDDGGDTWVVVPATVTPSLAKPGAQINITLEQGAPYSQIFTVRAFEDPSWALAATVATSGEPWLTLSTKSGNTPFADSLTISTAGLAPGVYTSTITISAPQSFNKSVSVPVQLTVKPLGSLGTQFGISTIAGNGAATTVVTSGTATNIGIGAPVALTADNTGRLVISSGNRIWQFANSALTVLAGSGTLGSSGDGVDAASASLANPEAIGFDQQGALYFTEYSAAKVRKILNGALTTVVDFSKFGIQTGSHGMLFDSSGRILLANPQGLLRWDGSKLTVVTSYAMTDPFGIVADSAGNVYVSDRGTHQIVEFSAAGPVSIFAGLGTPGYGGDGGAATQASLNTPSGLAIDSQGTIYIADTGNQRIRTITSDGVMHTVAGSGVMAFAGDGTTADFAEFANPSAVWVDSLANLYVADTGNNRVRKLSLQTASSGPALAGLLSAASGSPTLAPGEIFALYGSSLAPTSVTETTPFWPTQLGGVTVTINGVAAPLYYVLPGLIAGQVPYETLPGPATAAVSINGSTPVQTTFQVATTAPAIFLVNSNTHIDAVNYKDATSNASEPAPPGSLVLIYLTGIGTPSVPVATGAPSPSVEPLGRANYPYSITINGQPVTQVPYLGLSPAYVGVAQANIIVPNMPPGDYPLVITVNGVQSNAATISIGPQ
ncbi:MAG TPA: hypothetical protein VKR43_08385 [Bryobacteraceae bacterium]|nr:hypothetical protein [Bryobacteraceae bacterium]